MKRGLRNSVLLPTLNVSVRTWSRAQQLRVSSMEKSYLGGTCGLTRWDGVGNENVVHAMWHECVVVGWDVVWWNE